MAIFAVGLKRTAVNLYGHASALPITDLSTSTVDKSAANLDADLLR